MMVYRLCVSTKKTDMGVAFAYAFYNQHDFCVYKKMGCQASACEREMYINVCAAALTYFRTHMRNRYYDEHFSELIDEDEGTVLCPYRDIVSAFEAYREENDKEKKSDLAPLYEHFDTPSVSFVCEENHPLQQRTADLMR